MIPIPLKESGDYVVGLLPDENKKIRVVRRPFRLIPAIEVGWEKSDSSYGVDGMEQGDEGILYKGSYYPLHWFEPTNHLDWEMIYRLDGLNEMYIRKHDEGRVILGTWGYSDKGFYDCRWGRPGEESQDLMDR